MTLLLFPLPSPWQLSFSFLLKKKKSFWKYKVILTFSFLSFIFIYWTECGEKGMFLHCWRECKLIQSLRKIVWRFLKKLGIKPPNDPAIPLLGIYPEETKIEKDTCIPLFIAALFTIARTWKQPRCPWTDEWIKKLWYIYTMQYHSAIKRNIFESVLMKWMNPEPITEWSESERER